MATSDDVTEEDWLEELQNGDLQQILDCVCMAMDLYANKKLKSVIKFARENYQLKENKWDWICIKRGVVVSDDSVLISFGLQQNIKRVLQQIPIEIKRFNG